MDTTHRGKTSKKTNRARRRPGLTSEQRAQRLADLRDDLASAVARLAEDVGWVAYLEAASRFGSNWSFNNLLLILLQASQRGFTPTDVRTAAAWKKLGYSPKRYEKALWIFEPRRYRLTEEQAADHGEAGYGSDGKPRQVVRGVHASPRFDISQTTAPQAAHPGPATLLGEDPSQAWDAVAAQVRAAGFTVERGECGSAYGYADPASRTVRVRADVDDAQAVKTLVHELAHIRLDHVADMDEYRRHRGRMESEAESVAFIVLGALGLDTSEYSVPYIATWSKGNLEVLAEIGARVTEAAHTILDGIEAEGRTDEQAEEVPEAA